MAKGDHLVVRFGAYTHHGIDLGNGQVIHYGRGLHDKTNAHVEIVDIVDFAGDLPIVIRHDDSGFSPDEIIQRATSRIGEGSYDLFGNNCEHFVNWCRRGVANSAQVNLVDSIWRRGSAATAKLVLPRFASRYVLKKSAGKLVGRFGLPASLAGDAVQLSAEVIAIRMGKTGHQTRSIGQQSGALASSGIGYMLGGPAGAAVGFSSWLFGEVIGHTSFSTTRCAARRHSGESGHSDVGE